MKRKLLGCTLDELKEIVDSLSLPSFTAKQIADWLYKKRVRSIVSMTNLSKIVREKLSESYDLGVDDCLNMVVSVDGTKKYLFNSVPHGKAVSQYSIESVIIPDNDRVTICVSSQAGCKMACEFCMTGRQGFNGNLDTGSILSQFIMVDESLTLTNAVFMGMGEPLDNLSNVMKAIEILTAEWGFGWSPKRITLSTIGVTKEIGRGVSGVLGENPLKYFLDNTKAHLAISLHNPFPNERRELMPSEKSFPLEKTLYLIKQYDFTGQRRVSFEYIMFDKINDDKRHADHLAMILRGVECRVNLIRFHKIPGSSLDSSPYVVIEQFRERLMAAGVTATIRASRGEDILAACGMLSGKGKNNKNISI